MQHGVVSLLQPLRMNKNRPVTVEEVTGPLADVTPVENEKDESPETPWKPCRQTKFIFIVQCIACFVVGLDATIITTSLSGLAISLDVDTNKAFWIASSYLLASAVFQPPIALLSDVFGRKALFLGAVSMFTIGTVVCCACTGINGILAGRAIQGIGGGGVLSMNLIILSDLIPLRQRAQYQGYLQLVFALGSNTAPVIGGAIIENTTWRWLFIINLPICVAALVAAPFVLRYESSKATLQSRVASIDWTGIAFFIVSVTTFLVGISWGGTVYSWVSAATLCPLLLGVAGVVGTILWEVYGAEKPFLRLSILNTRSATATYICTVLMAFLVYGCLYYLVLWAIAVKGMSNIMAGVAILPIGLTVVPVGGITGTLISKIGRYQWAVWAGWAISTLGTGLMILLDKHTATVAWVFIFLITGTGQGLMMISLSAATQAMADTKDVAYASSMFAFMRSLGLCFGVSIGGTIFQNFLLRRLEHLGLPATIGRNAEGFAPILRGMAASAEKEKIVGAYAWAFQRFFATLTGIGAVGLLISLLIGRYSLDKKLDSEHVLRRADAPGNVAPGNEA